MVNSTFQMTYQRQHRVVIKVKDTEVTSWVLWIASMNVSSLFFSPKIAGQYGKGYEPNMHSCPKAR